MHRLTGGVQLAQEPGLKFITRELESHGIPAMPFPVDAVDARSWDDEPVRQLLTEFIEDRLANAEPFWRRS